MNQISANVQSCLVAVEVMRAPALRVHEDGVRSLCSTLCGVLGLDARYAIDLCYAAGLHDVGKVVVPDAILNKPGPLDSDEWSVMRQHPLLGFNILRQSRDATVKLAANAVLHHHECWDGSGYPDGLVGEAIPREARIVAICDVYHALREPRPYRAPMQHDVAIGLILQGDPSRGMNPGQFDPEILAAFAANTALMCAAYEGSLTQGAVYLLEDDGPGAGGGSAEAVAM